MYTEPACSPNNEVNTVYRGNKESKSSYKKLMILYFPEYLLYVGKYFNKESIRRIQLC